MEQITVNTSLIEAKESRDEGTPTGGGGPNPLNLPVILRQIFINLSTPDLIKCSEVNKFWNYEARTVLRDFKTCIATNKGGPSCSSLRDLDADLSRMNIVPYNGLRLQIRNHPRSLCTEFKGELFQFLLNHLHLKVLKIDEEWTNKREQGCPAIWLIPQVLNSKHLHSLEELDFLHLPTYLHIPPPYRFEGYPKLRVLRIAKSHSKLLSLPYGAQLSGCPFTCWLDAAPNLKTLDVEFNGALLAAVRTKRDNYAQLIRNFRSHVYKWKKETWEYALQQPKLERLTALAPADAAEDVALSWDSLRLIFLSSAKWLTFLDLDIAVLATIPWMNTEPFERLKTLEILMTHAQYEDEEMLNAIRRVNFTRLFPSIHSVTVYQVTGPRLSFHPEVSDLDNGEAGDTSQVTQLNMDDCTTAEALVRYAEIFPHVTSLSVSVSNSSYSGWSNIYDDLWSSWMDLTTMRITQTVEDRKFNLDADLCGIFPEEVDFLQEQDDEFLKNYHLVPVQPGLFVLKGLTQLHIDIWLDEQKKKRTTGSTKFQPFFFSKVTGHCVISKMRQLEVTLQCNLPEVLEHLGPFVKLVGNDGEE